MTIKRINAVSCAKIMGLLYAMIGFFIGGFVALAGMIGLFAASVSKTDNPFAAVFGIGAGIGAVVFIPLLYGALGFVMTWIAASIYNVLAGVVGGVQVEVVPGPNSQWSNGKPQF